MNREIKFRAWFPTALEHGYDKRMIPWEIVLNWHDLGMDLEQQEDISIKYMQFTGLKDKNGKEIYEEDILVYRDNMSVDRPGVKFDSYSLVSFGNYDYGSYEQNESGYGWFLKPITDKEGLGLNANYSKLLEVIGNIYENPELLKGIDNV